MASDQVIIECGETVYKVETTLGKYRCPKDGCMSTVRTVEGVERHIERVHGLPAEDPRECEHCGSDFRTRYGNDSQRFCSVECSQKARRKRVEMQCEHCGERFEVVESKADSRRYCSKSCSRKVIK